MNLSALFIRRPVTTTLLMLGILVFGAMAYRQLPVSDLPNVDFPTIQVSAALPGASPETMAAAGRAAAREAVRGDRRPDVDELDQHAGQHQHHAAVRSDRNIDAAAQDVQAMIARAARALPPQMPAPPSFQKVNPADQPVIVPGAAVGDAAALDGQRVRARRSIAQRISMVSGVAQVRSSARRSTRSAIDVDPRQLAAHGIGIDEVATAIANANVNLPTGTIYGADQTFIVQANGQLLRAAAFGPTIVAYRNGNPVRLDEVAHVFDGVENDKVGRLVQRRARVMTWRCRSSRAPTSSRSWTRSGSCCRRSGQQLPASVQLGDPHRSLRPDPRVGPRRQAHAAPHRRARRAGHLRLPAERLGDASFPASRCPFRSSATFAVMYLLGYSLDNLSLMALTLVGRLRRRRRDRHAGEHRPAHGDGQERRCRRRSTARREVAFTIVSMTALAGRRVHPGAVHGRHRRPAAARVRGHDRRRDPGLRLRLDQPDADAVQPVPQAAARADARRALQRHRTASSRRWLRALRLGRCSVAPAFTGGGDGRSRSRSSVGTVYLFTIVPKGFLPSEDQGRFNDQHRGAAGDRVHGDGPAPERGGRRSSRKDPDIQPASTA